MPRATTSPCSAREAMSARPGRCDDRDDVMIGPRGELGRGGLEASIGGAERVQSVGLDGLDLVIRGAELPRRRAPMGSALTGTGFLRDSSPASSIRASSDSTAGGRRFRRGMRSAPSRGLAVAEARCAISNSITRSRARRPADHGFLIGAPPAASGGDGSCRGPAARRSGRRASEGRPPRGWAVASTSWPEPDLEAGPAAAR